jgi:hypothetical protein
MNPEKNKRGIIKKRKTDKGENMQTPPITQHLNFTVPTSLQGIRDLLLVLIVINKSMPWLS